jgi:hypothetical protein
MAVFRATGENVLKADKVLFRNNRTSLHFWEFSLDNPSLQEQFFLSGPFFGLELVFSRGSQSIRRERII